MFGAEQWVAKNSKRRYGGLRPLRAKPVYWCDGWHYDPLYASVFANRTKIRVVQHRAFNNEKSLIINIPAPSSYVSGMGRDMFHLFVEMNFPSPRLFGDSPFVDFNDLLLLKKVRDEFGADFTKPETVQVIIKMAR